MAKYSYEFKAKVVQAYMSDEGGYEYIANKYCVSNKSIIIRWVNAYKEFGIEGLMRSRKKETYSFEFKFHNRCQYILSLHLLYLRQVFY